MELLQYSLLIVCIAGVLGGIVGLCTFFKNTGSDDSVTHQSGSDVNTIELHEHGLIGPDFKIIDSSINIRPLGARCFRDVWSWKKGDNRLYAHVINSVHAVLYDFLVNGEHSTRVKEGTKMGDVNWPKPNFPIIDGQDNREYFKVKNQKREICYIESPEVVSALACIFLKELGIKCSPVVVWCADDELERHYNKIHCRWLTKIDGRIYADKEDRYLDFAHPRKKCVQYIPGYYECFRQFDGGRVFHRAHMTTDVESMKEPSKRAMKRFTWFYGLLNDSKIDVVKEVKSLWNQEVDGYQTLGRSHDFNNYWTPGYGTYVRKLPTRIIAMGDALDGKLVSFSVYGKLMYPQRTYQREYYRKTSYTCNPFNYIRPAIWKYSYHYVKRWSIF